MGRTIYTGGRFLETIWLSVCVLPALQGTAFAVPGRSRPPNIILIRTEDICPDIECYGTALVKTPNLNRLAAEGVRFTNAFSTSPVCSPSKSAMMTGMYQTAIGAHHHRTYDKRSLPEPVRPITHILRDAGYFTAAGCGFNAAEDLNFACEELYEGNDWREREPSQPFFARVSLNTTHRPFSRDPTDPIDPGKVIIPPYYPDTPLVRRDWADYLESIQLMDGQVGQILRRLEQEGLKENTVVFFISDHGRCHVRGKQWLYDGGIHIPMIVRWPGRIRPGQVCDDLVSGVDIPATVLKIAHISIPPYMHGRPFLGEDVVKREAVYAARDRCDAVEDRVRCVRTERFKYIRNYRPEAPYTAFGHYKEFRYPTLHVLRMLHKQGRLTPAQAAFMADRKPLEELYDLRDDPHEINNLAKDPRYTTTLNELRARLDSWIDETGDMGAVPESEGSLAKLRSMREEKYRDRWKARGIEPRAAPEIHVLWWKKHLGVE